MADLPVDLDKGQLHERNTMYMYMYTCSYVYMCSIYSVHVCITFASLFTIRYVALKDSRFAYYDSKEVQCNSLVSFAGGSNRTVFHLALCNTLVHVQ